MKSNRMILTMKKVIVFFLINLIVFLGGIVFKYYYDEFTYNFDMRVISHKDNGLLEYVDTIPDEKTALKIAKAVWLPIYGRKNLFGYSYKIELINESFWVVMGVKRIQRYFAVSGGGPYIEIDKKTGRVIKVGHSGAAPRMLTKPVVSTN